MIPRRTFQVNGRFTAVTHSVQQMLCRRVMPAAQQLYFWIGRLAPPEYEFELYLEEFVAFSGYCLRHARRAIDQLIDVGLVEVRKWYHQGKRYFRGVYRRPETIMSQTDQECPGSAPQTTEIRGSTNINKNTAPTHPAVDKPKPYSYTPVESTGALPTVVNPLGTPTATHRPPPPPPALPPAWLESVIARLKKLGVIISKSLIQQLTQLSPVDVGHGLRLLEEGRAIRNPTGYFLAACHNKWRAESAVPILPGIIEQLKLWKQQGLIVASMQENETTMVAVGTIDQFTWMPYDDAARLLQPAPQ